MSIPEYMNQCLTHPEHGYYTSTESEIFGSKGDFVTSPEISSLFGEMIGLWIITEWIAWGRPTEWDMIELGPGKGTLMGDIIRVQKIANNNHTCFHFFCFDDSLDF